MKKISDMKTEAVIPKLQSVQFKDDTKMNQSHKIETQVELLEM